MESESIATGPPPESVWERVAVRLGRWNGWLLASWAIVYLACAGLRATTKPLWFDELYSFYLAGLPSFGDFWASLRSGYELNPPLLFLIDRACFALLGPTPL